jgi:HEPN domain-containing protein
MANRAHDWLRQAERDLEHAISSRSMQQHEWACFASHQAAEKALKAMHLSAAQEAWGHVLTQLIDELPATMRLPSDLLERARVLDGFYIPARYPNGHPAGAPFEHYGPLQSEQAVDYARQIVEFARHAMA